ncbi:alpha-N-acetylglucosaminidase [Abortiporus biennis]|nr:alpha-N-acetylglucosaminidase [Abortiporus biennis]
MRWISVFLLTLPGIVISKDSELKLDGVYALAKRRIPSHAKDFSFEAIDGEGDTFVVADSGGKSGGITVSCTSVSACARGLYAYLTGHGKVNIWWTGSRLDELPSRLPPVPTPFNGSAIVQYRYHFNTVTFGYTTAFWSFDKWSLLLDWMALRGINLPLAWVGYETILIQVFKEAGLSDTEISTFLSDPAFLPWNRFGNLQGSFDGGLPMQWVNDQFSLQKQIVKRMVELGMTPVLPSFTGFVPRALASHYPNASIVSGSQWSGFPSTFTNVSFLEPFDPLFTTLQKSFITKQQAAYGNISHIYTLDQYNENNPFSGDTSYLRKSADPEAVWLMQGWLFFSSSAFWTNDRIEAYLGSVEDNDAMIILDLYSEAQPQWNRTQNYFGKTWVWCELHDYGGNMGMEGNLQQVTSGPITALNSPGSSMKGVGLTMEGQEGNEIVYDILLDQAWSSSTLDIPGYVQGWVERRYGIANLPVEAQQAWSLLSKTVYDNQDPNSQATIKSILELSPSLTGLVNRTGHHPTLVPYDTNTTIVPALKLILQAANKSPSLKNIPEFRYDTVDITRQLLANRFIDLYQNLLSIYNTSASSTAISKAGSPLINLLHDLDDLLSTNENFLLSTWISDAKQWSHNNASYAKYLEFSARNQITLWGPDGEINDYASKQWAGLVREYYVERWQTFIDYLASLKQTGVAYNSSEVSSMMIQIGKTWDAKSWGEGKGENWNVKGDTFEVVDKILDKWL